MISTSYIARLNATAPLHMRRLTRLTLAFSKRLKNSRLLWGLPWAFTLRITTLYAVTMLLRCTPAMTAGIKSTFRTLADLVEAAS